MAQMPRIAVSDDCRLDALAQTLERAGYVVDRSSDLRRPGSVQGLGYMAVVTAGSDASGDASADGVTRISAEERRLSVAPSERSMTIDGRDAGALLTVSDSARVKPLDATLCGLGAAALALQRAVTVQGVFRTVPEELRKLNLTAALLRVDSVAARGSVLTHNLPVAVLHRLETLIGANLADVLPPSLATSSALREAFDWPEPVRFVPAAKVIEEFLPASQRTLADVLTREMGCSAMILAPIRVEDRPAAVLAVAHEQERLTAADADAVAALARTITAALERACLLESERDARGLADRLRESTLLLNTSLDLKVVLGRILEQLAPVVSYTSASVHLREDNATVIIAAQGLCEGWEKIRFAFDEFPYVRTLIETGQPLLLQDVHSDPEWHQTDCGPDIRSVVVVPLVAQERVLGFLSIDHSDSARYTQADVEIAAVFARHAAVAIENARLFQELSCAKERLDTVLRLIPDALTVLDEQGRIVLWNRGAEELFGWPAESVIGRPISDLEPNLAEERRKWEEAVRTGKPASFETRIKNRLGTLLPANASLSVLVENGQPRMTIALVRDMTERERLQAQLLQAEKLAAVGQLVSGIAHELNNPLTSVLGMAQLLQLSDLPSAAIRDLQTIQREAERAARIVSNLVSFAGKRCTNRTRVDVNQLLRDTLRLTSIQLQSERTRVIERFGDHLPHADGDPQRLQQVFLRLMHNASQAMSESHGSGTLTISTRGVEQSVRIEFADDGPGIPAANLSRVFDPFFTTREVGKGAGLGLSVAYGIVVEHGGRIWAESELGHGSTFVIELPIEAFAAPDVPPEALESAP